MFMSVKLDRLAVGMILKQEMVFLISVRSVRTMSSYPANGRVRTRDNADKSTQSAQGYLTS